MSNEFDRTYEFKRTPNDTDVVGLDAGILCAIVTPKDDTGIGSGTSVPADVVLDRWAELAHSRADAIRREIRRLTCIFSSAELAMDCAETMRENRLFDSETEQRIGFHVGPLESIEGQYGGPQLAIAETIARKANPDWVVTTRSVYDRLPIEDQMKFYSLDFVALEPGHPPMELFRVADGTDYLGAADPGDAWGPYTSVTLTRGEQRYAITPASSPFRIGRGKVNDLQLEDMFVSVEHASIEYRDGEFMLIDRSSNGTFVAADHEPPFRSPRTFKLRKPGSLWFGRPPGGGLDEPFRFHFD